MFRLAVTLLFVAAVLKTVSPWPKKKPKQPAVQAIENYNNFSIEEWNRDFFHYFNESAMPTLNKKMECDKCPDVYMPVCASDKITYTNKCYMLCSSSDISVDYKGECFLWRMWWE